MSFDPNSRESEAVAANGQMERHRRKNRSRIGNKGIGFLALARYCNRMVVTSSSARLLKQTHSVKTTPTSIDIVSILGVPISPQLLKKVCRFEVTRSAKRSKVSATNYKLNTNTGRLAFEKDFGPVDVTIMIDCNRLGFQATLDFGRLLKLAILPTLKSCPISR